ncbi:MAG: rod shape-determining protein MreC [Clostridiales bacterium]|nr:rod shape-determining protein MreC [Clostridiales bacterium]
MALLRFFRNRPWIIIITVSVLLVAAAVITSQNDGNMNFVGGIAGEIIAPVQKVIYSATSYVYNSVSQIKERRELRTNYQNLKERVAYLEKELLRMNELEKQNQRLRKLLDFATEREEFVVTGARVTGKDPGNWFEVFTIDKGKNHGISVNMAVVTEQGLVGRVIEVGSNWSKVQSIIDGRSSVSGIIERTRDNGVVKGNNLFGFEDGTCSMIYLPLDSEIVEGDKVITSGLGDILPKGIYIGEVKEVTRSKRELYKTAIIEPAVDFRRLEEVLVVKARVDD